MGKGRKRKQGKREPNGRIKRNNYPAPNIVQPSEWVKAMREKYGEHHGSALGRAYASGLLGEGVEAKNRLNAGKRFSRLYSALIDEGRYRCPLGRETRSGARSTAFHATSDGREDQDWLFDAMNRLDKAGLRPWLDQLILDAYHDHGPYWLTNLINGGSNPKDKMILSTAIQALDCIAPKDYQSQIVVSIWP